MLLIEDVIRDRGSRYAVSGGPVRDRVEVDAFLKALKKKRKFARATHNSWAVLLPDGPLKADDGEGGAGNVILQVLEGAGVQGQLVVVTRWFGGTQLGGDRFRHVASAAQAWIAAAGAARAD